VHYLSQLAGSPLVDVNCAAIPEELIESELFGHEKGAFTGAASRKRGKFDLADGGTLFLDEIADMSLKTQAKILRILQEQRFERVGGTSPIMVNVRVLAATNKDLNQEIAQGRFREDLFYRLNVIPIHVPPLRERADDIPLLAEEFLAEHAARLHQRAKRFSPEAMEVLMAYAWPGNVRELKNMVERLTILSPGQEIVLEDLPASLRGTSPDLNGLGRALGETDFKQARAMFEKMYLERKLHEHQGNISQTAEAVGLERSYLHKKLKSLGL
jgi:two-component system nitrogen regulation response regulator NtrX